MLAGTPPAGRPHVSPAWTGCTRRTGTPRRPGCARRRRPSAPPGPAGPRRAHRPPRDRAPPRRRPRYCPRPHPAKRVGGRLSPDPRSAREVPGAGEAEESVAGDADRDQAEQERPERLLEHLVQRDVEAARLLRVVGDGGVAEEPADDGEGDALGHVAGLAERDVRPARLAAVALGVEVLAELLGPGHPDL